MIEQKKQMTQRFEVGDLVYLQLKRKKHGLSQPPIKVLILAVYENQNKCRVENISNGRVIYANFISLHEFSAIS